MLEPYSDAEMSTVIETVRAGYYDKVVGEPKFIGQMIERLVATALHEHQLAHRTALELDEWKRTALRNERLLGEEKLATRAALAQCDALRQEVHEANARAEAAVDPPFLLPQGTDTEGEGRAQ